MLATRLVQDQGVHVEGINFFTGFCVEGHTHAIRKRKADAAPRNNALWVAEQLGMKLHIIDVVEDYKDVVLNPAHGYGQHLNPCLDCKIFMVGRALQWARAEGFDFIITGEVLGQRPKSQRKEALPVIARESEAEDLLLRPLSAQLLPPTRPEREGWVDREQLLGLHGRNRKPQIELAQRFGFTEWAQPAGGCCFLTNRDYADKLGDLWRARGERRYSLDDIMLLKVGRHLRIAPHCKLIIAREDGENNYLRGYRSEYPHLRSVSHNGPLTLVDGMLEAEQLELAARIVARYSQGRDASSVVIEYTGTDGVSEQLAVAPLAPHEIDPAWHVASA